jgi:hypothetical protein
MDDVLAILREEPNLSEINECEEKYQGYMKSLEKDGQTGGLK